LGRICKLLIVINSYSGLQINTDIDWQPTLRGKHLYLRPLQESDFEALYKAASDPLIWEQHPDFERYKIEIFKRYFDSGLRSQSAFVLIDSNTNEVIGSSRYNNYLAKNSSVEIGYTFLVRKCWGGHYNQELKSLMLNYAFQYVNTVNFIIGENNQRSRKAVEKIGGTLITDITDVALDGDMDHSVAYRIRKTITLKELGDQDEQSFLNWVEQWKAEDLGWATFTWEPGMSHTEHLQKLEDKKDISKIPSNRVPDTMLYAFLGNEIVGRLSIRHELNSHLLERGGHLGYAVSPKHRKNGFATEIVRQGLVACRKLGLDKVLITCGDTNVASWKIIEKFGGSMENRIFDTEDNELVRRYWLSTNVDHFKEYKTQGKVVAYITRTKGSQTQLLVFDHDKKHSEAGTQVPAGTIATGENIEESLLREISEEAGIQNLKVIKKIDEYTFFRETHKCFNRRHVYHLESLNNLPDKWTHTVTGDGIDQNMNFHYYWLDLDSAKGRLSARLDDSIELLRGNN